MGDLVNVSNYLEDFLQDYQDSQFTYDQPEKIVLICVYVVVFILALVGNLLILLMVCVKRSVRKNVTNFFLVNLTIADLLVTLVCIPLTVGRHIYTPWLYGEFLCKAMDFFQGIYVEASVLTIVCMSAERFLAIRHPLKARVVFTAVRVKQAIVLTWITAAITMCPLVIFKYLDEQLLIGDISIKYCIEKWPSNDDKLGYNIFLLFVIYIVPGVIVVVLYSMVGFSLCRQDHRLQRANSCARDYDVRVMGTRRRLGRMMVMLSVLFAFSWMPYFILSLCSNIILSVKSQQTMNDIYPFALLLGHSNCAQNPLLYSFMHRGFHKFVDQLLRCRCDEMAEKQSARQPSCTSVKNTASVRTPICERKKDTGNDVIVLYDVKDVHVKSKLLALQQLNE